MHIDLTPPSGAVRPGRAASRRPIARFALIALLGGSALGFGACATAGTAIPSIAIPSVPIPSIEIPSGLPTSATGSSPVSACVDAATYAVIQQLKTPGADVASILNANKTVLLNGLQTMQVSDPTTMQWRTDMQNALSSGNMTAAATQAAMLTNGQVSLSSC
jgi:hypothetical protein